MVKQFEELVKEIETKNKELTEITGKVISMENIRLEKIINIALSGLTFHKIWNVKDFSASANRYEYFFNAKGNYVKGILVSSKDSGLGKDGIFDKTVDRYELWFTPKCFIKTHTTGTINTEFGLVDLKREIVDHDVDVLSLDNDNKTEWNIDDVIESIFNALKNRRDDLKDRVVSQKDRMKKITELKI